MGTDISTSLGSAIVTTGGTTAPASGTPETWTVTSQVNIPAASTGVAQFRVVDAAQASNAALAEIFLVTNVAGSTWTATRGAEAIGTNGTTPVAHAANWTAVVVGTPGAILNMALQPASVHNYGTVTTSTVNMVAGTAVHNATLTASDLTPFVFPHAVGGESGLLCLTNSSGAFQAPSLAGFSGDSLSWPLGQPYWNTAAGALNEIGFIAITGSTMQAFPLTGWPIVTSQITPSGSLQTGNGTGTTYTISVASQAVGTFLALAQFVYPISTVTAVATTGGPGTTAAWAKIDGAADSGLNESIDLWYTTVTGVGAMTMTVSAPHGGYGYIQPFTTTVPNPVWTLDVHGNVDGSGGGTTTLFPSLTPTNPNELYVGAYTNAANACTLTTAGYAQNDPIIWNLNVSTVQAPSGTQASGQYCTAAGLIQLT